MKYIDGKKNLTKTILKHLVQTESDEVMLTYTNINDEEIVEVYNKKELFQNLFCEKLYESITDETVVTLATDDLVVETTKINIGWWMKPIHFAKLDELFTGKKPVKKTKQKVEISEKTIAVGTYEEHHEFVYDISTITVSSDKPKDALNWLNEKIEYYKLHRKYEKLRVCLNYTTHSSDSIEGWFTIEELLEKGIAKI